MCNNIDVMRKFLLIIVAVFAISCEKSFDVVDCHVVDYSQLACVKLENPYSVSNM